MDKLEVMRLAEQRRRMERKSELKEGISLKEFVDYITKEMTENKWENIPLRFMSVDSEERQFLSIYKMDGCIAIDVGTEEEDDEYNKLMFGN